ncbi:acyloxyacyl hydrolase [Limimaricola pyoseonensis]|uniref:Lipid A 3-O-deacylase (PagL) n=1 Tax=Limimaricola pyoseonensis TaxID=521013 RepID=A0A1G7AG18_9RHOB|nr:acyloxyacyl hydrolase [Limimaricola pyoseonensis]SDE13739.1 Lipid A 3-O-deacylase (PagL) [Limimaricola pyoseonensis]
MDAAIALLFAATGFGQMALEHCPNAGCFALQPAQGRQAVQVGNLLFQEEEIGEEIYLQHHFARRYGPFQPLTGLSVSSHGDVWAGIGVAWTGDLPGPGYLETSLMPGVYLQADGPDLGHPVEFRSSIGVGVEFGGGARLSMHYDHRSNADISGTNPGLESLGVRFSMPL